MVPLFVLILIAAVLWLSGTGRSSSRRCPAKARATKAAAPDTTTMTERPAISQPFSRCGIGITCEPQPPLFAPSLLPAIARCCEFCWTFIQIPLENLVLQ